MSHFAAITLSPQSALPDQTPDQVTRGKAALHRLAPRESIRVRRTSAGDWILSAGSGVDDPLENHDPVTCFLIGKGLYDPLRGEQITPGELAKRFTSVGIGCFSGIAPPAGGCILHEQGNVITAFTDVYGLQHVFFCQSPDCVAVGSSALLVATIMGDHVDLNSFGVFGLLGHPLGERCGFQNTRKLPAGSVIHLRCGDCQIETYRHPHKSTGQSSQDLVTLAKEGAEILKKSTAACLSAYPQPDLELSGGLDSRLILAAIPPSNRRELRAVTLGQAEGHDRVTAKLIADHEGMAQHPVELSQLGTLPPGELLPLIQSASLKTGHSANPFGRGVLEWVNSQVDQRPRLSGQNGEYIRGFYYPGQPDASSVSPRLVESLARWRMWTNQGVDLSLFTPEYRERIQSHCLESLNQILCSYGDGWLLSTDEFYLKERMGRWVGMDYSASSLERVVLAPFFHPAFVDWARPIPPIHRRGSRLSAAMLEVMDPYLPALPLDGGIPAHDLAHPSLRVQLAGKARFAAKVAKKAWQRLTGQGKPPYGAETLYQSLIQHHPRVLDLLPHIQQSCLLNPRAIEEMSTGQRLPDWKSLGFLLNLEWTYEFLETGGTES